MDALSIWKLRREDPRRLFHFYVHVKNYSKTKWLKTIATFILFMDLQF